MIEAVRIPEISENVDSGTVVSVHVQKGDSVAVDDILIELETDKAVVEIPSTVAGVVKELLAKEGDEKKVGDVIARIDTAAKASAAKASAESSSKEGQAPTVEETSTSEADAEAADAEAADAEAADAEAAEGDAETKAAAAPSEEKAYNAAPEAAPEAAPGAGRADAHTAPAAPSVRRLARELGVDLRQVTASGAVSGPGGHLTAGDVKAFAKASREGRPRGAATSPGAAATPGMPDFSAWGEVETVDLAGIRKITAANMATAWATVPHVTQFDEADVTDVEGYVRQKGPHVEKAGGKLTLTAVLVKVIAAALQRHPYFNASIDPEAGKVIIKKYVHIGVAVATEHGLMVPVVRDADRKNLTRIAVEIFDLAQKARNRKIQPREMEGATFTLSNQGGIGGVAFTPIIAWPQVAILGVSRTALRQRPVGQEGLFASRRVLPLSLSYDHRLIDGADAAAFLRWVCETLEAPLNLVLDSE
jgi:pyruvate dehydrogenase E2 component (dihydrolipoamide acetyltransferase)